MESDFTDLLAEFIRHAEPDLDRRLESQAEALTELKCTQPILGKWVDEHDTEYLLAAFALDDDDFAENFPRMAKYTQEDRKKIIDEFENHFNNCPRCHLKRGYDLEFNSRIEQVCRQNRAQLLHHLRQAEDPGGDDDPQGKPVVKAAHF